MNNNDNPLIVLGVFDRSVYYPAFYNNSNCYGSVREFNNNNYSFYSQEDERKRMV